MATVAHPPISLYLHVPFCTVRCSYCDFNAYAGLDGQMPAWETAIREELRRWAPAVAGRPVATVFLGGGTPSLLAGATIDRILATVREHYPLETGAEITMEANPESVWLDALRQYRDAGVNRISLGVQSLDDGELRFLDRLHDARTAQTAFEAARTAGFDNVSIDLIFGLPGQTLAGWQRTLNGALAWAPDHMSCYALTVEEGTPLAARVASGAVGEAESDIVASMYEGTVEQLRAAGYEQYEISNFARGGRTCRHNLVYWRHQEYVGVGPGAHGFVNGVRYAVERSPARYIKAFHEPGGSEGLSSPAVVSREVVDERTAALDTLVLGLRLNEGIAAEEFVAAHRASWEVFRPVLEWAEGSGLVEREDGRVRLTSRGRLLSNEVLVRLLEPGR